MTYKQVKNLKPTEFKRLCGVYPETFQEMVKVVAAEKILQKKTGRPSKVSVEDQILMTLTYWREYRTYFHIGTSLGVDETTALRIIRKVEDILIQSGLFNLPGKKAMQSPKTLIETVAVDVTEQEIERPKKNKKTTIAASENVIR